MSSARETKGLGYYFRFDINTIQGRITAGFAATALLAFMMVTVSNLQWKTVLDTTNYTRTVNAPSQLYALQLLKGVDNSLAAWERQHVDNKPEQAAKKDAAWKTQIQPALDSLGLLAKLMTDDQGATMIASMKANITHLKNKQYTATITPEVASAYMSAELEPLVLAITATTEGFRRLHSTQQQQAQAQITASNSRLPYLLALGFVICIGTGGILGGIIVTSVLARVRFIKHKLKELGQGNLPDTIPASKDELNSIITAMNDLTANLRQVQHFANQVGKGNFDGNIKVFNDEGDLGISLAQMRDELRNVAEEDKQRNWVNEGLTSLGEVLRRNGNDLPKLGDEIVTYLVKYLQANQGGFFMVNDSDASRPYLTLQACYAYNRKKFINKEIAPGEGLVGQTWQEAETMYLRDIPQDYLRITSGLGGANPRYLLIVPLKNNGDIAGILELASFQDFMPYQIAFVEKIAESIASTITGAKVVEKTNQLLAEAQQMTEQMHAQEEEMRQNMEELQATQEEMMRAQRETYRQEVDRDTKL